MKNFKHKCHYYPSAVFVFIDYPLKLFIISILNMLFIILHDYLHNHSN